MKPISVPSKVPYIGDILKEKKQLFIGLTETWLKDHKDAEINIEGYKVFRSDRKRKKKGRRGRLSGGVAIYVRDDIASTTVPKITYSNGVIEMLGLYSPSENLFIAIIYRQPDDEAGGHRSTSSEFKAALDKLAALLNDLPSPAPNVILGGDFNLPNTSWPGTNPTSGASKDDKEMLITLQKFQEDYFLKQHITAPTHILGNTLDLVFTNNSSFLHSYECLKPLQSISDHYLVECYTQFNSSFNHQSEEKPDLHSPFDKLNFFSEDVKWNDLIEELNAINWLHTFNDLHPDVMLSELMQQLLDVCNKHVPVKKAVRKTSLTKIPRERRILMRKRRALNLKLKHATSTTRMENIQGKLINIEILLQRSHQASHQQSEQKAINAIKTNPKYFFSYAKKFSKLHSKIGPLLNENNQYTASSIEMANILKIQYESVFSDPIVNSDYIDEAADSHESLLDMDFSESDFHKAIDELSNTSSSGPDGIPAILLKKCKPEISKPLFILWRKALDLGTTPSLLKLSHIIPIHKGDHRGVAANYRPIALTSHFVKLFEKVLRNKLVTYLEDNNLLNPSQHGFRRGRSCLSQLLAHYDQILTLLEQGMNVDTIYLDFAKAFNKVDHRIILAKLSLLGIGGNILKWIRSFLVGRTQQVLVNGFLSDPSTVRSGVPQGSVIGPLLFLILIGDIDAELLHSMLSSFADDTRAAKGISNVRDASLLQTDLEKIYAWAEKNNQSFNNTKLNLLRYGNNSSLKEETSYQCPDGTDILQKSHVKDLGVIMSDSGDFSEHINIMCEKAKDMCSWILRTFRSRSPETMKTLWKSLVLPILDYCSQLWCPTKQGHIQQIEAIQKSFTNKIKLDRKYDYWDRLSKLKLYSLQRRRERYRILYIWKILENQVPNISCEGDGGIQKLHTNSRNGRTCKLPALNNNASAKVKQLREGSLKVHGSQLFNALPRDLRNKTNCTLLEFKNKLDAFLQKIEDKPLVRGYTAARRTDSNSLIHTIPLYSSESSIIPPTNGSAPALPWH